MADTYNYNDDQNGRVMAPSQPLTPQSLPPHQVGMWDWIRNNRMAVIIGILILAGLIWWFCMRKTDVGSSVSTTVNVPPGPNAAPTVVNPGNGLRLTKVRGGSMY